VLLAIDVGNTNTVLGMFDQADLIASWRIKTDARTTADEMVLTFRGLLSESAAVTGIALCSTVPAVLREMRVMLARYFADVPTVIVEPGTKTGVPVLTDNPKEVGADRIANAIAAFDLYGGPTIVADFGTATTCDAVSENGEYLGGAIAPGVEISMDALVGKAAALRAVELRAPRNVLGKSTVESIQSGAVYGFASQVDGLCDRIIAELGECTVVSTGGLADLITPFSSRIQHTEPWLTLHGLRLVYEKNQ